VRDAGFDFLKDCGLTGQFFVLPGTERQLQRPVARSGLCREP
jgi:hypothetical protein